MATFSKLPGGWKAEVFRRKVRKSQSGFATKAEAVAWAGPVEAEIMAGAKGGIPNLTMDAVFVRYRDKVAPRKKGARWEIVRIEMFRRDALAAVRLREFGPVHVAAWRDRRLLEVSGPSVRREWNLLSYACNLALYEWGWLKENPFAAKFRVKRPPDSKDRERIATPAEIKLLDARAPDSLARVIRWALESGMRASEIAGLGPGSVQGRLALLGDTKNGDARKVPLSKKALAEWTGEGFGLTKDSISAMFAKLTARCAIEDLTFHDLRATAATRLAKRLHPLQLCKMFGWKDVKQAMRYYREPIADMAPLLD